MSRIFGLVWVLCSLAAAQQPQAPRAITPFEAGANLPAQKIGANDLIAVAVYDAPEMTRTVRVGADGTIRLPMVKQRIQAAGLMPSDVRNPDHGRPEGGAVVRGSGGHGDHRRVHLAADLGRRRREETADVPGRRAGDSAGRDHAGRGFDSRSRTRDPGVSRPTGRRRQAARAHPADLRQATDRRRRSRGEPEAGGGRGDPRPRCGEDLRFSAT